MFDANLPAVHFDPIESWNKFLLCMIGMSVATERVTEMTKQWVGPTLCKHLSTERYSAFVQLLAIVSGIFVTALSGLNPVGIPGYVPYDWWNHTSWLAWIVTGILVSGGSAFWNHLLDILQAAKTSREQGVQAVAFAQKTVQQAVNAAEQAESAQTAQQQ